MKPRGTVRPFGLSTLVVSNPLGFVIMTLAKAVGFALILFVILLGVMVGLGDRNKEERLDTVQ